MKNKFFATILILVVSVFLFGGLFFALPKNNLPSARGDSGWDADYNDYDDWDSGDSGWSGGGSGGGWSSGGGDSWSSGGGSSGGSGRSYSGESGGSGGSLSVAGTVVLILFCVGVCVGMPFLIIALSGGFHRSHSGGSMSGHQRPVIRPTLPEGISEDPEFVRKMAKKAYDDYVKIQIAWMDRDLEPVRNLLTDEMYNMYQMQIDEMKENHQINVMKDFKYNIGYVCGRTQTDSKDTVKIVLGVYCKDYVVNEKDNSIISGNPSVTLLYFYELTYVKDKTGKDENHCPNCGAPVENQASQTCPHCGTTIVLKTNKYTLSNKKMLRQYKM